jgi:hypothetical protein
MEQFKDMDNDAGGKRAIHGFTKYFQSCEQGQSFDLEALDRRKKSNLER